jgi:hypothetical protein
LESIRGSGEGGEEAQRIRLRAEAESGEDRRSEVEKIRRLVEDQKSEVGGQRAEREE